MANIILDYPDKIYTEQFNDKSSHDIGEIKFYINKQLIKVSQVFVIIKSSKTGMYEIIELAQTDVVNNNILYQTPINQEIRIKDELCYVRILIINCEDCTYLMSQEHKVNISAKNYNLARQVYIAKDVGAKVEQIYAKILAISDKMKGENGDAS